MVFPATNQNIKHAEKGKSAVRCVFRIGFAVKVFCLCLFRSSLCAKNFSYHPAISTGMLTWWRCLTLVTLILLR